MTYNKNTHFLKVLLFSLILISFTSVVFAPGISPPYWYGSESLEENALKMYPGETKEIELILQISYRAKSIIYVTA